MHKWCSSAWSAVRLGSHELERAPPSHHSRFHLIHFEILFLFSDFFSAFLRHLCTDCLHTSGSFMCSMLVVYLAAKGNGRKATNSRLFVSWVKVDLHSADLYRMKLGIGQGEVEIRVKLIKRPPAWDHQRYSKKFEKFTNSVESIESAPACAESPRIETNWVSQSLPARLVVYKHR